MKKTVKGKLGFGCMRLPMKNDVVDMEEFNKMVDYYIESGFNYFDTAHMYTGGRSEEALREGLVKRHDREEYILVDKLSSPYFQTEEDIVPFFESQLEICGVDYFDYYLLHSLGSYNNEQYRRCNAYNVCLELKKQGRIKHLGMSFHDKAPVLEEILKEFPEVEVVQIQFNYLDYEDLSVDAKNVYEVCRKYNKPVIIMEPVKGGHLANLPTGARAYFDELGDASYASYAIRFAAGFEGVFMVLSGMSNMEQMKDNVSFMKDIRPLDEKEMTAVRNVRKAIKSDEIIQCTACHYCTEGCPVQIKIPEIFACVNNQKLFPGWNADMYCDAVAEDFERISDCIKCGACEEICPQHLKIRDILEKIDSAR